MRDLAQYWHRRLLFAVALLTLAVGSVLLNWCMAMNREVWRPLGVLEPVIRVLTSGFELPALTTLSRMEMFRSLVPDGVSPLPLFALAGVIVWLIWKGGEATG